MKNTYSKGIEYMENIDDILMAKWAKWHSIIPQADPKPAEKLPKKGDRKKRDKK